MEDRFWVDLDEGTKTRFNSELATEESHDSIYDGRRGLGYLLGPGPANQLGAFGTAKLS